MTYLEDLERLSKGRPATVYAVRVAGCLFEHTLKLTPPDLEALARSGLKRPEQVKLREVNDREVVVPRSLVIELREYLVKYRPTKPAAELSALLNARLMTYLYPLLADPAPEGIRHYTAVLTEPAVKPKHKKRSKR